MELIEKRLRKLVASEGMMLTQSADVKVTDRVFTATVLLAVNDSEENWKEVPVEEAERLSAEAAEIRRAEEEQRERDEKRRQLEAELAALTQGTGNRESGTGNLEP